MPGRRRNKETTRAAVAQAARELFARDGFDGTTIRAIAARAGVATGTVLLYGPSKTELLLGLFVDELDQAIAASRSTLDPAAPLPDQLAHLFAGPLARYAAEPALSRVYIKETLFPPSTPTYDRYVELTTAFIAELADRITTARPGAPAMPLALAAFGVYLMHVTELLRHARPPPLAMVTASLAGALAAILPPPPR